MEKHTGDGGINPTTRRMRTIHHEELEAALEIWVKQREARRLTIKGGMIKTRAERIEKASNIEGECLEVRMAPVVVQKPREGRFLEN